MFERPSNLYSIRNASDAVLDKDCRAQIRKLQLRISVSKLTGNLL
jgi:hypothetical protein